MRRARARLPRVPGSRRLRLRAAGVAIRVYAVIANHSGFDNVSLVELDYPWVLASFASSGGDPRQLSHRPALLLDSGAFSVWTLGRTVNIEDYIAWASELRASYEGEVRLFNLDVIPGELTRTPTKGERERAVVESAENAATIREAGLPVIEVYHRYEPLDVFEAILDRRRPGELVAIGGLVGRAGGTADKIRFCDGAFAALRDFCGGWGELAPVHGLGISGDAPLARRYPWFSVDSTTWMTARNFNLHVRRDGKFAPRNRETAPRTTKNMTALFRERRLENWLRAAEGLSKLWAERGVRFAPDVVEAVA